MYDTIINKSIYNPQIRRAMKFKGLLVVKKKMFTGTDMCLKSKEPSAEEAAISPE